MWAGFEENQKKHHPLNQFGVTLFGHNPYAGRCPSHFRQHGWWSLQSIPSKDLEGKRMLNLETKPDVDGIRLLAYGPMGLWAGLRRRDVLKRAYDKTGTRNSKASARLFKMGEPKAETAALEGSCAMLLLREYFFFDRRASAQESNTPSCLILLTYIIHVAPAPLGLEPHRPGCATQGGAQWRETPSRTPVWGFPLRSSGSKNFSPCSRYQAFL